MRCPGDRGSGAAGYPISRLTRSVSLTKATYTTSVWMFGGHIGQQLDEILKPEVLTQPALLRIPPTR